MKIVPGAWACDTYTAVAKFLSLNDGPKLARVAYNVKLSADGVQAVPPTDEERQCHVHQQGIVQCCSPREHMVPVLRRLKDLKKVLVLVLLQKSWASVMVLTEGFWSWLWS